LEHPRERGAGADQRLQVWLPVLGERGRHGHHDRLHLGEVRVARGRLEAVGDRRECLVRHVLHVRLAAAERLDHAGVHVDPDHVTARLAERHGQRQSHVAEPHDPDSHRRSV
jgi:hypothetical protein